MSMQLADRIANIVIRHLEGTITQEERAELEAWMAESPVNRAAVEEFLDEARLQAGIRAMYHHRQKVWQKVQNDAGITKVVSIRRPAWWRYAAAAAILILLAGSYFLFFNKPAKRDEIVKTPDRSHDVKAPETNRAMITLANGEKVYLDSAANGTLAEQGNIQLIKLANGQIAYQASPNPSEGGGQMQYNTLHNPRGSKVIDMQLSDGSQVWLNAGSSLTYPVAFVGNERKVSITGEAYFEIAHNSTMPFKVTKDAMEVTVLGTHFNVNAYDDEASINVTLLEGSVKASTRTDVPSLAGTSEGGVILKPGQQAVINKGIKIENNIDLEQVMAWKNGMFHFADASIETIMKEVSRWYDVEIVYEGKIKGHFVAELSRNVEVSKLLRILELTNRVHFEIQGRKIIVKQ